MVKYKGLTNETLEEIRDVMLEDIENIEIVLDLCDYELDYELVLHHELKINHFKFEVTKINELLDINWLSNKQFVE